MYRAYFRFRESPFAITPDPRFLFLSERHREALAHLLYGMGEDGGFVQLTGEVGTGKTTLCRSLLEQAPEGVDVALILNPRLTPAELVATLCDELRVEYPPGTGSLKILVDQLNRHLLRSHAEGRRTVLVVDEAQNLSVDALEQVRLLTNLETSTRKLLQIILIGQPELQAMLDRPELRQLAQRITARYHLPPLAREETAAYVRHRLEVAGLREEVFTAGALRLIHRLTGGIPRLINILCDRALLGAYARQSRRVGRDLVRAAAAEVRGGAGRRRAGWAVAVAVASVVAAAGAAGWRWSLQTPAEVVVGGRVGPAPASEAVGGPPATAEGVAQAGERGPRAPAPEEALPQETGPAPGDRAPVTLEELLTGGEVATDAETAFSTLFRYWDLASAELAGITACQRAAAAGLRCLYGRGTWANLKHYNRPAVLELADASDRRHRVVVGSLGEEEVTLDFGSRRVTLRRSEVEPFWVGGYILLWRQPVLGQDLIRPGSSGSDVQWLRAQLDRVEGVAPGEPGSPVFDPDLRERVRRFQRARGLRADGVVGEQTLIQLNTATGEPSIPLLWRSSPSG